MLSAIIITKNQENVIGSCVKSLSWTDECIVVDNGSTDETATIAKKNGAIVCIKSGRNFAEIRNAGAQVAKGDWLLYVDTDEEIPPALIAEIQKITATLPEKSDIQAYVIKRQNYYLGKKWPYVDGMIRLIYKPSLIEWFGELHETARINGTVGTLDHLMIHKTHRTLEEMVEKTNQWSEIEAQLRLDHKHPRIVSWRLLRVFITGFLASYIKQGGWKMGTAGCVESMYQGFSMFITYAKLWEKQQKKL